MSETGYTRKELIEMTGIAYYNLTHLRLTKKLPILKEPTGRGIPTIYHPNAIAVIKHYMDTRRKS
jgi:hypothetical protein